MDYPKLIILCDLSNEPKSAEDLKDFIKELIEENTDIKVIEIKWVV
ncbi:MAG: hypothetical protein QXL51_01495 [Candidatus Aenigmatarchaeota archaeon]